MPAARGLPRSIASTGVAVLLATIALSLGTGVGALALVEQLGGMQPIAAHALGVGAITCAMAIFIHTRVRSIAGMATLYVLGGALLWTCSTIVVMTHQVLQRVMPSGVLDVLLSDGVLRLVATSAPLGAVCGALCLPVAFGIRAARARASLDAAEVLLARTGAWLLLVGTTSLIFAGAAHADSIAGAAGFGLSLVALSLVSDRRRVHWLRRVRLGDFPEWRVVPAVGDTPEPVWFGDQHADGALLRIVAGDGPYRGSVQSLAVATVSTDMTIPEAVAQRRALAALAVAFAAVTAAVVLVERWR